MPVFGLLISKALFALMIVDPVDPDKGKDSMQEESLKWILYMFIAGCISFVATLGGKFLFGVIAENITINVRSKLYSAILQKHMGWFDERENSAGVMVSVLASDVSTLNGASSEAAAIMVEISFGLICGIALGFYYYWQLSLVALGCIPFMILGGIMDAKLQAGFSSTAD